MITWRHALDFCLAAGSPTPLEEIPLQQLVGQYLAADVSAPLALPGFDNSAMDGYAVRSNELPGSFSVSQTIFAGDQPESLQQGTIAKIMTGAAVPHGADAVVMKENAATKGDLVTFLEKPRLGKNIRIRDEDVKEGDLLARKGTLVTPALVALMKGAGITVASTHRKVNIHLVTTGKELVNHPRERTAGKVIETNGCQTSLHLAKYANGITTTQVGDSPEDLFHTLRKACMQSDVVITIGGASVGDADHLSAVLTEMNASITFNKVAIKPGKPFKLAICPNGTPVFCLPGNPVSAMVCLRLFVMPTIEKMLGASVPLVPNYAKLTTTYTKKRGRTHFIRGVTQTTPQGIVTFTPLEKQGSGQLSSLAHANALAIAPAASETISEGLVLPCLSL